VPLLSPNGKIEVDFRIATLRKDFARLASSLTAKVRAAVKYGPNHRPARRKRFLSIRGTWRREPFARFFEKLG